MAIYASQATPDVSFSSIVTSLHIQRSLLGQLSACPILIICCIKNCIICISFFVNIIILPVYLYTIYCIQPSHAGATKLFCPQYRDEGAGFPISLGCGGLIYGISRHCYYYLLFLLKWCVLRGVGLLMGYP
jgi:hypothetical protein